MNNQCLQNPLIKMALGRVGYLGSLYDCRSDGFCGCNIFKENIPDNWVKHSDNPSTYYLHEFEETYKGKFESLNIEAELQLSLLAGIIKIDGSGKYLSDNKKSAKSTKCSLIYRNRRVNQEINLFNEKVRSLISSDILRSVKATHVVVGVEWGANVIISAEYIDEESENNLEAKGNFQGFFDKIVNSIKGKLNLELNNKEQELKKSIKIKVCGDITMKNGVPNSIESALELMGNINELIDNTNDGKGVQLQYILFPLRNLDFLEFKIDSITREIDSGTVTQVKNMYDQLLYEKQKLNDAVNGIFKHEMYVKKSLVDSIRNKVSNLEIIESCLRGKLGKLLIKVRSGKENMDKLQSFISENFISSNNLILNKMNEILEDAKSCRFKSKLDSIERYKRKNMIYLSRENDKNIEELEMKHPNSNVFIFYNLINDSTKNERKLNETLFFKLHDKNPNDYFYVVNCDLFEKSENESKPRIEYYNKTQIVSNDYFSQELNKELTQNDFIETGPNIRLKFNIKKHDLEFRPKVLLVGHKDDKLNIITRICSSISMNTLDGLNSEPTYFGDNCFNVCFSEDSKSVDEYVKTLKDMKFNAIFFIFKYEYRYDQMLTKFYEYSFYDDTFDKKSVLMISNWDEAKDPQIECNKIAETFSSECDLNNIIFFSNRCDPNLLSNIMYSCISNICKK